MILSICLVKVRYPYCLGVNSQYVPSLDSVPLDRTALASEACDLPTVKLSSPAFSIMVADALCHRLLVTFLFSCGDLQAIFRTPSMALSRQSLHPVNTFFLFHCQASCLSWWSFLGYCLCFYAFVRLSWILYACPALGDGVFHVYLCVCTHQPSPTWHLITSFDVSTQDVSAVTCYGAHTTWRNKSFMAEVENVSFALFCFASIFLNSAS